MKIKSKGKDVLKVAAVSALAVGMFSAAFMGVNRLAFAAATNDATTLEIAAAPFTAQATAYTMQDEQDEQDEPATDTAVFTPPTVTFVNHTPQEVPSHAISKEEALLIGAEYIWDVLGGCIDGMYVEMSYFMMPGFTRPFWLGSVTTEKPPNLDFEDFEDDLQGWMEAQVFTSYFFRLDAITGMRVDVSYSDPSHTEELVRQPREEVWRPLSPYDTPSTPEEERAMRNMEFMSSWFVMSADEQLELSDITPQRLEAYTQTALGLAQRHFDHTTVESIQLGDAWAYDSTFFMERIEDDGAGGKIVIISSVAFTAVDQTGREAIIRVPTENASWQLISVGTMHNEFIPGFSYESEDSVG